MDASTGWVVGSEGIVRTEDGGATWTRQFWMRTGPLYGISCVDANTATAVGVSGTILRTNTGGK